MNTQSLTTFRFIAAAIVVFFHYGRETSIATAVPGFIESAREMITFFFVLSGFILVVVYYQSPKYSTRVYFLHRVARVAPAYFMALAPMLYFIYVVGGETDYAALILCLFFVQAWFPEYALSINYPAWSLSVEAAFYLTFPLTILYLRNSSPSPNRFLLLSIGVWLLTQTVLCLMINSEYYLGKGSNNFYRIIYCSPLANYSSFLLGIAGAYYVMNIRMTAIRSSTISLMMTTGVCLFFFLLFEYRVIDRIVGFDSPPQATAPLFLLFIILLSFSDNLITRVLSLKYVLLLGEASYALYIFQVPVKKLSYWAMRPLELTPDVRFYVYFLILTGVSVLSYLYFEKPIRTYARRFSAKPRSLK